MGDIDVDSAISTLLSASTQPPGTEVNLPEDQICKIVRAVRAIFMSQPMLIEIKAPVNICGDTHGQFSDLLRMLDIGGIPPASNYLFLGDYVDRAKQSIEVITLMMCFKLKYPECVFLLRGNHECASLNRIYGFYDECKRRYSVKLWRIFADAFNCMPVVAVVEDKIICMHGGLSPDLEHLSQIFDIPRPTDVPDEGLLCDLLWADPDSNVLGWGYNARYLHLFILYFKYVHNLCRLRYYNYRGVSYTFGHDVIADFLERNGLDLICRAHQVVEDGYEFQADRKLVTIFSAPNYCGEFDNAGGMMVVKENLVCSFKILRPS